MSKVLEGKVAVVTGSGQGIGRAIAIEFAKNGAKVITNNRKPGASAASMVTEEQINSLPPERREWFKKGFDAESGDAATTAREIKEMGLEATPVFCDITKIEDAERLIQTTIDTYGRIDILCDVAGGFGFGDIEDITVEHWNRCNEVKPKGFFYTMKYAIPHMRKQKSGRIILCASPAFAGSPLKQAAYVAANAGVVGLTYAGAIELNVDGITVNCFCPGAQTRASYELDAARDTYEKGILAPGRTFMTTEATPGPEHVAALVLYLASDKASRINGSTFFVSGPRIGLYTRPTFEKMLFKDGTETWGFDELSDKFDAEILPDYKNITE